MRQSTRLMVNATASYIRQILTVGLGLVTTRLVIKALGFVDYGIIAALGISTGIAYVVSSALAQSSMRHMAYEIGRNDEQGLKNTFSTVFFTLTAIGIAAMLVILAISWPLVHVLNIPDNRTFVAWLVLCGSALSLAIGFSSASIRALFMAHQRIILLEILNITTNVMLLCQGIILLYYPYDGLALVPILSIVIAIITFLLIWYLWFFHIPYIRPCFRDFRWREIRRLFTYAGWSFLGQTINYLRLQVSQLVVNIIYGPVANTAFGLGWGLSNYAIPLGNAISRAAQPAAISLFGKNDRASIQRLAVFTCKVQPLMTSVLLVPLLLDTRFFLHLWVDDYPEMAVVLAQLILPWAWIMDLTSGIDQARMAYENVSRYVVVGIICESIGLICAGIAICFFEAPVGVIPACSLLAAICVTFIRVSFFGHVANLNMANWPRLVLLRVFGAMLPPLVCPLILFLVLPAGWPRLLAITGSYGLILLPFGWFVGLTSWERQYFKPLFQKLFARLGIRRTPPISDPVDTPP